MRSTSIVGTSEIYECGSLNAVVRTRLSHAHFRAYSLALKRLIHGLGEAAAEEIWKPILTPLRRYGFALCAAPLPFNEPSIQPKDIGKLHSRRDALAMVYPSQAVQLGNTIQLLEGLIQSTENPYETWLVDAILQNRKDEARDRRSATAAGTWFAETPLRNRGERAVLIRDARLVTAAERQLFLHPATRHLSVITPAQLTKDRCFDVLYVLGAARWFPGYIFDAPRSRRTELVRYAWIKDGREPAKTFLSAAAPAAAIVDDPPEHEEYYDAADLLPVVDWRSLGQKMAAAELQNPLESAEATLILLEGDTAVFLESADGGSVLTIDLDADESTERIARITTNEVRPGTYLLLRTSGGGDYIVTEADRHFLRERASEVREAQQRWKALLRQEVQKDGILAVGLRLIDLGSSSAELMNVRNYMSPRSLRTRAPEDFKAIMRLVGLGEDWERYWDMMGEIDHAHRHAGHRIRRQLLRRLEQLDLTELERVGRMEIALPEVDAGGFTAFRVLDVAPDRHLVSIHRLGHPFEL
jgi:hypothetical protein